MGTFENKVEIKIIQYVRIRKLITLHTNRCDVETMLVFSLYSIVY